MNPDMESKLSSYFGNWLEGEERKKVEAWRDESPVNRAIFEDSKKVWEQLQLLKDMKKFKAEAALDQVHKKIARKTRNTFAEIFRRVAAILLLPLVGATLWLALEKVNSDSAPEVWNTLETPAGMRSSFTLPDGSVVWLNSSTRLSYPMKFGNERVVRLDGEAYFSVFQDKQKPFVVDAGKIGISVTGTEFKASNYPNEKLTEIVLVTGSVRLFDKGPEGQERTLTGLKPGERFCYDTENNEIHIDHVDVGKYLGWKDGILVFRDDPMQEVVRRLNRWFNVNIQLTGPELEDYVYTATFENESLLQILELLRISAPIDYTIRNRERKKDDTFSKMEIVITQK